jgi:hypothetical protein
MAAKIGDNGRFDAIQEYLRLGLLSVFFIEISENPSYKYCGHYKTNSGN